MAAAVVSEAGGRFATSREPRCRRCIARNATPHQRHPNLLAKRLQKEEGAKQPIMQ